MPASGGKGHTERLLFPHPMQGGRSPGEQKMAWKEMWGRIISLGERESSQIVRAR